MWLVVLILREKTISCACFEASGSNIMSHWYAHPEIFCKSSLKDIEDAAESRTTEKSEVSSEKGWAFFVKSLNKSLIQTKKDKNSRMCDHARIDHWEPLFGVDHLGINVSARINFYIYLETLANKLNHIMPNSIKGFW